MTNQKSHYLDNLQKMCVISPKTSIFFLETLKFKDDIAIGNVVSTWYVTRMWKEISVSFNSDTIWIEFKYTVTYCSS